MIEATKESIEGKQSAFLSSDRLLGEQEREQCQRLAAGDSTYSRRAQALLALDQGATQKEAGQLAELSPGTVRYWLGRFRDMRMAIFPDDILRAAQPTESSSGEQAVSIEASEGAIDSKVVALEQSSETDAKKKTKEGKTKKGKGKKGKKKDQKKDKKSSAGKKSARKKKKKK